MSAGRFVNILTIATPRNSYGRRTALLALPALAAPGRGADAVAYAGSTTTFVLIGVRE